MLDHAQANFEAGELKSSMTFDFMNLHKWWTWFAPFPLLIQNDSQTGELKSVHT